MDTDPLILTASMDALTQARCQVLRDAYFPPALNIVPAHISLLHQTPQPVLADFDRHLIALSQRWQLFNFILASVQFTGRGMALTVQSPELADLRTQIITGWEDSLTPQDRQPFRPHVTIQNKVTPEQARIDFAKAQQDFKPVHGQITGLQLWFYRGGLWELCRTHDFHGLR